MTTKEKAFIVISIVWCALALVPIFIPKEVETGPKGYPQDFYDSF
jgi:hypothetical protein